MGNIVNYRSFRIDEAVDTTKQVFLSENSAYKNLKFSESRMKYIAAAMAIKESIELPNMQGNGMFNEALAPVTGIGAVVNPGVVTHTNPGGQFAQSYQRGSGDFPQMRIAMSMETLVETPGLELVPTIPIEYPQQRLAHLDVVYGGGNKDEANFANLIYMKVIGGNVKTGLGVAEYAKLVPGSNYVISKTGYAADVRAIKVVYLQSSRFTGEPIFLIESVGTITDATNVYAASAVDGENFGTIIAGFSGTVSIFAINNTTLVVDADTAGTRVALGDASLDTVSSIRDHIPGFNSRDYISSSMDRATGELSNVDKPLMMKMFSIDIEVGTIEVPIEVTRTELKDMGRYGIDVMGNLYKAARAQLSRTINREIREQFFRLGVTAAAKLKATKGIDKNLFIAPAATGSKNLSAFGLTEFKDIEGNDKTSLFTAIPNNESNSAAENLETRQFRVYSRINAVADLITVNSNQGAPNVGIVNVQVASILRGIGKKLEIRDDNTFTMDDKNLYYLGHMGNIAIYVDPTMEYADTRIALGINKGEDVPGLKFLPYDLVSSIETIDSADFNTKAVVTSRYAIAKTGFYPEACYFTFAINTDYGHWS